MLSVDNSILLIVDIQEKLVGMLNKDTIVKKACALAKAASLLGVETIVTEQYPKGLGATIEPLKVVIAQDAKYFEKTAFSALKEQEILSAIEATGKKHVIICGIEAHICVYQTCLELLESGYDVYVVKDASSSRNEYEYQRRTRSC